MKRILFVFSLISLAFICSAYAQGDGLQKDWHLGITTTFGEKNTSLAENIDNTLSPYAFGLILSRHVTFGWFSSITNLYHVSSINEDKDKKVNSYLWTNGLEQLCGYNYYFDSNKDLGIGLHAGLGVNWTGVNVFKIHDKFNAFDFKFNHLNLYVPIALRASHKDFTISFTYRITAFKTRANTYGKDNFTESPTIKIQPFEISILTKF